MNAVNAKLQAAVCFWWI